MEADDFAWVDTVPARPARVQRITVGEKEWVRSATTSGQPARLTARFHINTTEVMAVLMEDTAVGRPGHTAPTAAALPRLRIAGRTYLLSVEAPT